MHSETGPDATRNIGIRHGQVGIESEATGPTV
jgi:hypothetical protein